MNEPWEAIETRIYFGRVNGGLDLAGFPNAEAKARLIAAAPEMLEAAKSLVGNADSVIRTDAGGNQHRLVSHKKLEALVAVIAKAEVRP